MVVTCDASTTKVYIDGEEITSWTTNTDSGNWINDIGNADYGRIGGLYYNSTEYSFQGRLDEVTISDTARSAAWVKALYNGYFDSLMTFQPEVKVYATTASLTLSTHQATIYADTQVSANAAALTLSPYQADVFAGIPVNADTISLTISTHPASISNDINVSAALAALGLSSPSSIISHDIEVSASLRALALATHGATIWHGAAWSKWITANIDRLTFRYYFTLTGDADGTTDVTVPISSWQARRKSGEPTFLSVVIPYKPQREAAINARANGTMLIAMAYLLDGVEQYRETICRADLDSDGIRIDKGGRNRSITITGHKTESFTWKSIDLQKVVSVSTDNGHYRYRCATADLYLNPGDTARYDGSEIIVNQIVYAISADGQWMDVQEVAT